MQDMRLIKVSGWRGRRHEERGVGVHLVHDPAARRGLELGAPVIAGVHGFVLRGWIGVLGLEYWMDLFVLGETRKRKQQGNCGQHLPTTPVHCPVL